MAGYGMKSMKKPASKRNKVMSGKKMAKKYMK